MNAMNMAYHETEKRNFIRLTLISLTFTIGGILFVGLSMAAIAAVPPDPRSAPPWRLPRSCWSASCAG